MLHRDGAGLVIADLRIHILYDIAVNFIRQGVFLVELLYGALFHPHQGRFRLIQGTEILGGSLLHPVLLPLVQSHAPVLGQEVHGLDLGDFGQHGVLHVFLQRDALHGYVPHLRAVDALVLVLGVGQVYHHLRHRADPAPDAEHLVGAQACGEHHLCAVFIPAGGQGERCQEDTAEKRCTSKISISNIHFPSSLSLQPSGLLTAIHKSAHAPYKLPLAEELLWSMGRLCRQSLIRLRGSIPWEPLSCPSGYR